MTISTLLMRSLFTALLLPLGMPNILLAQVTSANDGTGTVVNTNGNQFNIEGGTLSGNGANLFHSLEKLGLNRDQIANFLANPQVQNILTRVVGGDASIINGLIQVAGGNANLYLMNPAGVIFGPNAMINVPGDFVVTTATGIGFGNDQWFKAVGSNDYQTLIGNPSQFAFDLANPGAIFNGGNLTVGEGKNISLIGGTVLNTGTISAPGGDIAIAAIPGTSRVKISKAGNLVSLEVELSPNPDKSQKINPLDLPTLLTEGAIFPENTETNLAQGSVITEGVINAAGTQGGQVALIGQQVSVSKGSIDVSGVNGGGTVRVGGDYQGKGSIPNATKTLIDGKSQIKADGLGQGDGGRVIVWADESTKAYGNISAQGGILGGDGGFIEISGKHFLDFNGNISTLAPNGKTGMVLFDPSDLTIGNASDSSINGSPNFNTTGSPAFLSVSSLESALANSNVTITTEGGSGGSGDIFLNASVNSSASNRTLTITSRYLTPQPGSTINLTGANSNLTLNINKVNTNATTLFSGTIQNAINSVGTVTGNATINLGAGTYKDGAEIAINKNLTLNGEGADRTVISGDEKYRVFNISRTGTTVNLNGLTITKGNGGSDKGGGIFVGSESTLNLNNSTLSENKADSFSVSEGGGIYNAGTITINNSTISNNTANSLSSINNNPLSYGGGIYNAGTATINNSTLTQNIAKSDSSEGSSGATGGGIFNSGTLYINNSTFAQNIAQSYSANGGGIANGGRLYINNSIVASNIATGVDSSTNPDVSGTIVSQGYNIVQNRGSSEGYISTDLPNGTDPKLGSFGNNGGSTQTYVLLQGSPTIDAGDPNSTLTIDQGGAQRGGSAGGLNAGDRIDIGAYEATSSYLVTSNKDDNSLGTLRSAIAFTNNPNAVNPVAPSATNTINFDNINTFKMPQTITLTNGELGITRSVNINGTGSSNLSISGNNASRVFNISGTGTNTNVTLDGLTITQGNEVSGNGGGILVNSGNTLNLNNSTLFSNSANNGGGIYNADTLTLNNSTIDNNTGQDAGGIHNFSGNVTMNKSTVSNNIGAVVGGISNNGQLSSLTVNNSTISNNRATRLAGGIDNNQGTIAINNSTISGNSSSEAGGGIKTYLGSITVANSIIAGNTAPSGSDVSGSITSLGNNLVGQNGNAGGFPVATFPVDPSKNDIILSGSINSAITPLGNYGGTTQTHALLPGSPAINRAGAGATTTDQRGITAVGTRDIGAFESRGFTLTPISGSTPQTTNVTRSFSNPLAVQVTSLDGVAVTSGTVNFTSNGTLANANLSSSTGTINSSGQAQVTATANNQAGSYIVTASGNGFNSGTFDLTNTLFANLTVDTLSDLIDDNLTLGNISLREAIAYTNPSGNITFATALNGNQITLSNGELGINKSLNITGNGANNTIISGNNAYRVFNISGTGITVNLEGLTIAQGNAGSGNGGGILVNSESTLNLINSTLSDNKATDGGAIRNDGLLLTVNNSTLLGNSATLGGGGIWNGLNSSVILSNSTVLGNSSSFGGGIYNDGILNIGSSTLSGNSSGSGGGINNLGTLNLTNLTLGNNTASIGSGINSNSSLTFNGNTSLASNITTNDTQTYNDPITLQGNTTLTGSQITLSNVTGTTNNFSINSGQDIILNANSAINIGTGNVQFDAARAITLNSGSSIKTTSGAINLNANTGGIHAYNSTIETTTGNIDLQGTYNTIIDNLQGGIYTDKSTIKTTTGNITLRGTNNTTGSTQDGILLYNDSAIRSQDGNIRLEGTSTRRLK